MGWGVAAIAGLAAWIWLREFRAHRPATPATLSTIVDLTQWTIDGSAIGAETALKLTAASDVQCAGQFHADPKAWSNIPKSVRPPPRNGYTKPFLVLLCQFLVADGAGTKIAIHRRLNFRKSDRGECSFADKVRVPAMAGEYELQLVVGVEPPDARTWDEPHVDWHVLARCNADVSGPQ
jgi:hypothetical protein